MRAFRLYSLICCYVSTLLALARPCAAAPPAEHVVLISVDGLGPDYYLEPEKYGLKIPALRGLMRQGAYARRVECVYPSVTFPAHTSMITGVSPKRHGVYKNSIFDPLGEYTPGRIWFAEDLKAPTLWDAARKKGVVTAVVRWPMNVGIRADYLLAEIRPARFPQLDKLVRALSTPELIEAMERHYGRIPPSGPNDRNCVNAAKYLIETAKPGLLLMHLLELDHLQHARGPGAPEVARALEEIDHQIAELIEATKRAGIYERTVFIIVSDHGHMRVTKKIQPNVLLRQAGLISADRRGRIVEWRAMAHGTGGDESGSAEMILKDPNDREALARVLELLKAKMKAPDGGIFRILERGGREEKWFANPEAALYIDAADGFVIGNQATGQYLTRADSRGQHGYLPERPAMKAALIAAGSGVRPGAVLEKVSMLDIAPTVAALLGLELPGVEGRALGEILN